ncbi:putative V-type proton ATPase subunit H [Dendrobium catenatum]|uniref:Putative V-type proton ATPase subunit H n=1 Tax=Dendrobium catenatum TaxID=906689 RepID=A0A2I0X4R3_9ASPA|nr:putative V-type proton ATPase subunit H [Dendrobium catenatum]
MGDLLRETSVMRAYDRICACPHQDSVHTLIRINEKLNPDFAKGNFIDYLATTRILPRLVEVVKGSTKEKVLEEGLKDNIKRLSSFDKYKQEVVLGQLDWSPMHKNPGFLKDNITNFEENDLQIPRVLLTILDIFNDPTALAVACYDLCQFIQFHPAGRNIVPDLKAKERAGKNRFCSLIEPAFDADGLMVMKGKCLSTAGSGDQNFRNWRGEAQ